MSTTSNWGASRKKKYTSVTRMVLLPDASLRSRRCSRTKKSRVQRPRLATLQASGRICRWKRTQKSVLATSCLAFVHQSNHRAIASSCGLAKTSTNLQRTRRSISCQCRRRLRTCMVSRATCKFKCGSCSRTSCNSLTSCENSKSKGLPRTSKTQRK